MGTANGQDNDGPLGIKSISITVVPSKASAGAPESVSVTQLTDHIVKLIDNTACISAIVELRPRSSKAPRLHLFDVGQNPLRVVVGDYTQADLSTGTGACGNAAIIEVDFLGRRILITSSVVGLPPIFYGTAGDSAFLSSPFLPDDHVALTPVDIEAVADTFRWGYPIDGRTIFANIRCVPPNTRAAIKVDRTAVFETAQNEISHASDLLPAACDLVGEQTAAFVASIKRIPTSDAFMSLSGGLDSRTALVALLKEGRRIPCVSIAGSVASADAQAARRFCKAYGLAHETIHLGGEFHKGVSDAVITAARLTGGVGCLSQTVDLYLYKSLGGRFSARISGNLGNQVGRGGVEGLAAARVCESMLGQELKAALARRALTSWLIPRLQSDGFAEILFGQEVLFSSVANYMLGSAFALQLTPYADTRLMSLAKASILGNPRFKEVSARALRRRDIVHRLLGPPISRSFQRTFLSEHDVVGSKIPINWGWRVDGGWSLRSRVPALRCAADALVLKIARTNKFAAPLAGVSRYLGHPSAFVHWPDVLRKQLRPLVCDVLLSQKLRESGLFDNRALTCALDRHFRGTVNHHIAICRAFEVGLGLTVRVAPRHRPPAGRD